MMLLDDWLRRPRLRNRYALCGNDPVNASDPDGHWSFGGFVLSLLGAIWTLPNTVAGLLIEITCLVGEVLRWIVWLVTLGHVELADPGLRRRVVVAPERVRARLSRRLVRLVRERSRGSRSATWSSSRVGLGAGLAVQRPRRLPSDRVRRHGRDPARRGALRARAAPHQPVRLAGAVLPSRPADLGLYEWDCDLRRLRQSPAVVRARRDRARRGVRWRTNRRRSRLDRRLQFEQRPRGGRPGRDRRRARHGRRRRRPRAAPGGSRRHRSGRGRDGRPRLRERSQRTSSPARSRSSRPRFRAAAVVRAVGAMAKLLRARKAATYENQSAGAIVTTCSARPGPTRARSATAPACRASRSTRGSARTPTRAGSPSGWATSCTRRTTARSCSTRWAARRSSTRAAWAGSRRRRRAPSSALTGGAGGGDGYAYAKHLVAVAASRSVATAGTVKVGGESPMSSRGDSTSYWLNASETDPDGSAGDGDPSCCASIPPRAPPTSPRASPPDISPCATAPRTR